MGSLLLKLGGVHGIFWAGFVFALVEVVLILVQFRNTNNPDDTRVLNYNSFAVILKYFKKDHIRQLLISLSFLGIGGFIVNSGMSLYMNGVFGTTGSEYGLYLGVAGVI